MPSTRYGLRNFPELPCIGIGLTSEGAEWIEIGRGYQSDGPAEHGGRKGKNSTSEIYIRNMFDAWLGYMTGASTHAALREGAA